MTPFYETEYISAFRVEISGGVWEIRLRRKASWHIHLIIGLRKLPDDYFAFHSMSEFGEEMQKMSKTRVEDWKGIYNGMDSFLTIPYRKKKAKETRLQHILRKAKPPSTAVAEIRKERRKI